ncbi:MAG: cAMP-binding protein [Solidesulfovibrio magneticus str. Maddingley MBC34]|uniref:cAMP-binding protein n=1 Tax=Solidesulfovibrio magneticus str. Maddingley MBC34 TaxID=1206767 RepID=K6GL89_9BACT|nr:MAG: cAMP-binding protein [Solidesulfovibrio magneticus str. Maddingley MBC34]
MNGEALKKAALFADLTDDERDRLMPAFTPLALAAGKAVIVEGQPGDDMFLLTSGRVRVSKAMLLRGIVAPGLDGTAAEKTLVELSDAQSPFFGEMALLDRDIRSATVTCLTDCRFLSIDRDAFFACVQAHPDLGVKLLTALAKRLAGLVRKNNVEVVKLTTALALVLSRRGAERR